MTAGVKTNTTHYLLNSRLFILNCIPQLLTFRFDKRDKMLVLKVGEVDGCDNLYVLLFIIACELALIYIAIGKIITFLEKKYGIR